MSKMAEMHETIEELKSAAASINAVADWLYQQFSGDVDETQTTHGSASSHHALFQSRRGQLPHG